MNRDILLLGMARESSTRCPNKMIRKFDNTTLFDIYLKKLEHIKDISGNDIFSNIVIAVSPEDKKLYEISKRYNVDIEDRNKISIRQGAVLGEIFNYLNKYDEEYVMWVNGCFPFLEPETIASVGNFFRVAYTMKSLHCIKRRKNWFWRYNKPINIKSGSHSKTQDSLPIYESVHCFHIFNREYLLDNCAYWDFTKNNPFLYKVEEGKEFLDIDTELDFEICEKLWESK